MSRAEGRVLLAEARRAGKKWAQDYLDSEDFQDYLAETLRCEEWPLLPDTKKRAERVADGIIQDLWNDVQRQYRGQDVIRFIGGGVSGAYDFGSAGRFEQEYGYDREELARAWWHAVREVLFRVGVRKWLGDEVKFRADECRQR